MNRTGTLAFHSTLTGSGTNFYNTEAIWAGTAGNIAPVARSDSPAPGTAGKFYWLYSPDISSTGKVAFRASLDSSVPYAEQDGVWAGPPARWGWSLSRQSRPRRTRRDVLRIQRSARERRRSCFVLRHAERRRREHTTNGTGLWTGPNANHLTLVARVGDHAPGTADGVNFAWPSGFDHVLNNLGQIAFSGQPHGRRCHFFQ